MITRLFFKNYRAFEELDIPLTKINLFFGPNNAGKSAILSAINLLSQTLDSDDRDIPLALTGKFEDLGTYKDVVYTNKLERDISLGLEFPLEFPARAYAYSSGERAVENARLDITFHYRKLRREIVVNSVELFSPSSDLLLRTRVAKTGNNQLIEQVSPIFSGIKTGVSSLGSIGLAHYIPVLLYYPSRRGYERESYAQKYHELDMKLYNVLRSLSNHLKSTEFIGPFRKKPERLYPFSGEMPSSVGVSGEKAINILIADESRRGRERRNITQKIANWAKRAGIAKGIELLVLTERHFEVRIMHYDTGENENIADVGYGCSQILPILVAGYYLPSESILIVEEPEIHLHPKAQAEVGTFLCEVAKRGIQLFVETHSEHLMLRLQSHVASGALTPKDVNVFYIYPDEQQGKKLYQRIPLGKDGFFVEDWPRGFFPEGLEEAERLAKFSV